MEEEAKRIRDVGDMPVFRCFYDLAIRVEKETRAFPAEFRWLRGQALRSSESVCANMTEGFYAQYSTEYVQSLYRCRREARETMSHLAYARDTGSLAAATCAELTAQYLEATRQLAGLIITIERKIQERGKGKPAPGLVRECSEDEYTAGDEKDGNDR